MPVQDQGPPLGLQAELVFPDGSTKRIDADAREAKDQPAGISFKTQRYTGFADAQLMLKRSIAREYPDLNLLAGLNLIGYDGSVAYEGRIGSIPRSFQDQPKITLMAQGWMSHARDQSFTEVFVDRDLSKWQGASRRRTAAVLAANYFQGSSATVSDESGQPVAELTFTGNWVSPFKPLAEAWWGPEAGVSIGALYFSEIGTTGFGTSGEGWRVAAVLGADDEPSSRQTAEIVGPSPVSNPGYLTATATMHTASIQAFCETSPSGAANSTHNARFANLAVYGTHGLARRGEDPGGFYVSDMIGAIASKWAPQLDTSRIQETTFAVPHASFLSETLPYDAFQSLNAYHRWEMGVYEKKRLLYYPIDLTDYDWEVRQSESGTSFELQGDDLEHLCNGVIVRFTNLATGYETRIGPSESTALKDENPDNPANKYGEKIYTTLSLSVPTTEEAAVQIGRIYLSEFNKAKAPGQVTVTGHIRDRAGHWQPGWKVRSSDRLVIADLPNPQVRIVGETTWDHDSKKLTMAVDGTMKRLDSILARLGVAVEASGLQLP